MRKKTKDMKETATDWIDTDKWAVRADIARLGLNGACEYQMEMIIDRQAAGDDRWDDITASEMMDALKEVA